MEFYTNVVKYGNKIQYRGVSNGKRIKMEIPFKPTFYVPSKEPSEYRGLDGRYVKPINFDSMYDAQEFGKEYKDVSGFEIYGNSNYVAQFIQERFPGVIEFDRSLINIFNFDIEVESEDGFPQPDVARYPIVSIAAKNSFDSHYRVWGLKDYDDSKALVPNTVYEKCKNEKELITKFCLYWIREYPDLITGWNVRFFDIPYLINRVKRLFDDETIVNKLSPWDKIFEKIVGVMNKDLQTYTFNGIEVIDYIDLFKKFGYSYGPQESYRLDHIAYVVLGERKLSYEEYGNLTELYKKDYQKFIDYNVRDVYLVDRIDEVTDLLTLALTVAYKGGVNYVDTLGTTAIWDSIIYRRLADRNIMIPPSRHNPHGDYAGGYVKEPVVGMSEWICSFDLNSLYPSIMVQWNMSPETLISDLDYPVTVEKCLDRDVSINGDYALAANGTKYRKDVEGILPTIIKEYYAERKAVKGKMIEAKKELQKLENELQELENRDS